MKNTDTKDKHTKNKFKKQKRKLFSIVAVGLLVLSIAMCSIFTALIYNKNLEVLYNKTCAPINTVIRPTLMQMTDKKVVDYSFNLNCYEDNNVEVIVKYKDTGEIYTNTRNCQPYIITQEEGEEVVWTDIGTIEYNNLRASMTDEQYNRIIDLLTTQAGEYEAYLLDITEYYYQGSEIKPVKVNVSKNIYEPADVLGGRLLRKSVVIESFELNPSHNETAVYRILGKDSRKPDIDIEFLLGEYKNDDLMAEIEGLEPIYYYGDIVPYDFLLENFSGPPIYFTDTFEFVLCHTEDILIHSEDGDFTLTTTYLEKVNTIEGCIGEILMMCGFVFYICAIAGIIIGAVLWKAMKKQLEQEERLRTVTNSMAHQLKTPLFVIGGYAENLAENVNTDKRTHYAQVITEQTNAMNEMVCKMLDYSRLDSESFTLNIERFELTAVAKEIIENYKLDNSQLECKKDVYIEADKKLIKSVVENLIDNAVKYSTDISKISIKINNNTLSVSNPYKALTNKELDDMWKPYYRSTEKEKSEGHGLGLAIVKSILDLHKFKYNAKYSDGNIIFSFEFK